MDRQRPNTVVAASKLTLAHIPPPILKAVLQQLMVAGELWGCVNWLHTLTSSSLQNGQLLQLVLPGQCQQVL